MNKNPKQKIYIEALLAGILTFGIIWFLYLCTGYAPFGNHSLASMDAHIQYLDFFAYLKDVLSGENSICYTFSKVLGGNNIGLFSYYLASPFNLLIFFFDKTELVSFFDLIVSLKLALAAITCSVFLNLRFKEVKRNTFEHKVFVAIPSVSYALCQYSIAQSSNIMWLDGVYMLPLILLGVYNLVRKRETVLLSISVAATILFNWYSGGINCLFSIFWFFFEVAAWLIDSHPSFQGWKGMIKECFSSFLLYIYTMMTGVLLSGILFFPTVGVLTDSAKGALNLKKIFDFSFIGNIFSVVENYVAGSKSEYGSVSLYCGSVVLLGCIGYFVGKTENTQKKILKGILLTVTILLFYWNPFCIVFSLLKDVWSYWYRYSYVGVIVIVYLSTIFYLKATDKEITNILIPVALVFSLILLFLNYVHGIQDIQRTYRTVLFIVFIAAAISATAYMRGKGSRVNNRTTWLLGVICVLFISETAYSVKLQMKNYHADNAYTFSTYSKEAMDLASRLKKWDGEKYRISQTATRNRKKTNLTAHYNEPLAYNYWAISGYSSSPDDIPIRFLERLGYRIEGQCITVVNTSILGSDSLLGVKYILSPYIINGLIPVNSIAEKCNGMTLYHNPYYLPMAFTYKHDKTTDTGDTHITNPFDYQNDLYSKLIGKKIQLYTKLDYTITKKNNKNITYTISLPKGKHAVYGNLPWETNFDATLNVNNTYKTDYAKWLSPSVFYIPTDIYASSCSVTVSSKNPIKIANGEEQFYALDLNMLETISKKLRENEVKKYTIDNGHATFTVKAEEGERLYVSIPYNSGWSISLNGNEIEAGLIGDCMYSIQLTEGKNFIEMTYTVKFFYIGIFCSLVGILMLAFTVVVKRKKLFFAGKQS